MTLGVLTVHVWPVYVGLSAGHPGDPLEIPVAANEPYDDMNYERSQITWETVNGETLGRGVVAAPKGVYTHILFFRGPHPEAFQDYEQLEQPVVFDRPGFIEINPIRIEIPDRNGHLL